MQTHDQSTQAPLDLNEIRRQEGRAWLVARIERTARLHADPAYQRLATEAVGLVLRRSAEWNHPRTGLTLVQTLRARYWWRHAVDRLRRLLRWRQFWSRQGRWLRDHRSRLFTGLRRVNGQLVRQFPADQNPRGARRANQADWPPAEADFD